MSLIACLGAKAAVAVGLLLAATLAGCAFQPQAPKLALAGPPGAAADAIQAPATPPADTANTTTSDADPSDVAAPAPASGENDPLERTNRKFFAFNQSLDKHIMRPVAIFYRDTLPDPMREGVHNFLANLDMPRTIANDILQGRPRHFIQAVGRAGVNSTLGIAGLVDVATKFGIPNDTADFGQTLGIFGIGEGPYLVIPFLGPKPPRDLAGDIADHFFDPFTYISFREKGLWMGSRTALSLLDERSGQIETVDKIQASSIDFYASIRNLYRQDRNAKINGKGSLENLPDF